MRFHKISLLFLGFLALGGLVFFSGCKKSEDRPADRAADKVAEKAVEKHISRQLGQDVQVDMDKANQKMTFTNKETGDYIQSSAQGGLKLPDEWPSEIKIYPHGKLVTVMKSNNILHLSWQTDDSQSQVRSWEKRELAKQGWQVKSDVDMGDSWLGVYEKDGHQLNLVFGPNDDGQGNILSYQYNLK